MERMTREEIQKKLTALAKEQGFDHTAFLPVKDLVFVEEYRKYCEDNLCGNYGKRKNCPPICGILKGRVTLWDIRRAMRLR